MDISSPVLIPFGSIQSYNHDVDPSSSLEGFQAQLFGLRHGISCSPMFCDLSILNSEEFHSHMLVGLSGRFLSKSRGSERSSLNVSGRHGRSFGNEFLNLQLHSVSIDNLLPYRTYFHKGPLPQHVLNFRIGSQEILQLGHISGVEGCDVLSNDLFGLFCFLRVRHKTVTVTDCIQRRVFNRKVAVLCNIVRQVPCSFIWQKSHLHYPYQTGNWGTFEYSSVAFSPVPSFAVVHVTCPKALLCRYSSTNAALWLLVAFPFSVYVPVLKKYSTRTRTRSVHVWLGARSWRRL